MIDEEQFQARREQAQARHAEAAAALRKPTEPTSGINAVTLKPAQCAVYLRPTPEKKNWFYRGFNAIYDRFEKASAALVSGLVRRTAVMMVLFVAATAGTMWRFTRLPTTFLPNEGQGYAIMGVQLPEWWKPLPVVETASLVEPPGH